MINFSFLLWHVLNIYFPTLYQGIDTLDFDWKRNVLCNLCLSMWNFYFLFSSSENWRFLWQWNNGTSPTRTCNTDQDYADWLRRQYWLHNIPWHCKLSFLVIIVSFISTLTQPPNPSLHAWLTVKCCCTLELDI